MDLNIKDSVIDKFILAYIAGLHFTNPDDKEEIKKLLYELGMPC